VCYGIVGVIFELECRVPRTLSEEVEEGCVKRFRGGLVFKAHRLVYHSTLGLRVMKKKKKKDRGG